MRRSLRLNNKPLMVILGIGLVLRLLWLWIFGDVPFRSDEAEYLRIADALRNGSYLDDWRWLRPPLYPAWLAITSPFGENIVIARLGQIMLGTLLIVLLYAVAHAAWHSERIALVCALLTAIFFPLIGYSNYLMAEMLLLVLLATLLLVSLQHMQQPSYKRAMLMGILLGLALLTKPVALAYIPTILFALWYKIKIGDATSNPSQTERNGRDIACNVSQKGDTGTISPMTRVQYTILVGLCSIFVIAPWSIRNAMVHHRFIPIDTTGGFNLWFGNRLAGEEGSVSEADMNKTYPNLADRNAAYVALARENALKNPYATLRNIADKARQFWKLEIDALATGHYSDLTLDCPRSVDMPKAVISGESFGNIRPACWWRIINISGDMVYITLIIGVLIVGFFPPAPSPLLKMGWIWVISFYGVTILTIVQPRLRMPLLPIVLPLASAGLVKLFNILHHHTSMDRNIIAKTIVKKRGHLVLFFVVGLCVIWVLNIVPLLASQIEQTLATQAWKHGHPQQSLQHYRAAIAWYPKRTNTLVAAGQVAESLGYNNEALILYQHAINVIYYQAHARIGAARILQKQGDTKRARDMIEKTALSQGQIERASFATAIVPPKNHIDIGDQAIEEYGYVLGFYPASSSIHTPSFRWTGERFAIRFGTLPTEESLVRLRLSTNRPVGSMEAQVKIFVNGRYMTQIAVQSGWWRTYTVVVPPTSTGVQLTMHTDTIASDALSSDDTSNRDLGIAVDWVALHQINEGVMQQ